MVNMFFIPLLLILTMIAHIMLGIFVLRKGPGSLLNQLVFGFTLNASLWSFAVLMIIVNTDHYHLLWWVKIAHVIAAFAPWFVLTIVYTFLHGSKQPLYKNNTLCFLFLFSLLLALLCLTPVMIEGLVVPIDQRDHIPGPLFPLYPIFFSGVIGYSLFKLFWHLRTVRGLLRFQIRLFIGGILISFIMGSVASLFLPLVGIVHLGIRTFGPVFSLVMVISITYAIVKYRLMDIRLALGKTLEYALSLLVLTGLFLGLSVLLETYTALFFEPIHFLFMFILLILATFCFPVLKEQARILVNRYFHRGLYDYHDTLLEAGKAMISILRTDQLLAFMVERVFKTMYIESAHFYLKEWDGSFYEAAQKTRQPYEVEQVNNILLPGNPILSYLKESREVLLLTDLRGLQDETKDRFLAEEMEQRSAEVAVPVIIEDRLEGVFLLGHKLSGEPYSKEDVNLLSALSYQLTVSLHNARLYNEMVEVKQYLENILDNIGNGVVAVDSLRQVTMFNHETEKLTGIKVSKAVGKKAADVLPPELDLLLQQTLDQGRGKVNLDLDLTLGGKRYFLTCSTALVELPETGERGAIMVLSDVTRLKELEQEKNQAQRLASLGKLAAGMAHEIKNPLVSIKTFFDLLPERYNDSEFRYDFSNIVSQEIERINKLVTDLLNLSKDIPSSFYQVDLAQLMEETLILLSPQLGSQGIQLTKLVQPDLPPVLADRDQLKQALFNICLNGVQAMPGGGNLTVEIAPEGGSPQKRNGQAASDKTVKIRVEDTGPGISPQEKERIFDPFYTTKPDGVGIGLSISHKIIADHGGKMRLFSSSKGTAFEIVLPASGKDNLRPQPQRQAGANLAEKGR